MKVLVTNKILDYENKPLKEGDRELIWRDIIFLSMNTQLKDEILTSEQKQKCYQITTKAYQDNEADYTVEQVAYILERVKKIYNPLVVGRAEEYFNKNSGDK